MSQHEKFEDWYYYNSWAYKIDNQWFYGGEQCTLDANNEIESRCPFPHCTNDTISRYPTPAPALLTNALEIRGLFNLDAGGVVHLMAKQDIPDISIFGLGVANVTSFA